ncbi:MAG: division/cell wall cluster transcriptional repressor MraZ [Lachnospiraceae bacterium]|nr:division/cell wall cluster transcriptional repressor MraZ [Lachnospiraceae bacterium]
MFMGEFEHSIDAKGRLIVPAKFREQLGVEFVVTKGLDGCLYGYPLSEWSKVEEKFRENGSMDKDSRKFARFFFGGAATCEVDKQGRILIPGTLREFAGLKKDVVFAGNLNRIEIWDKEEWAKVSSFDDMEEVAEHLSQLGLSI